MRRNSLLVWLSWRTIGVVLSGVGVVAALPIFAAVAQQPESSPGTEAITASRIVGWAVVNPNGTLGASKNVTGNFRHSTGVYEIVFATNVRQCTYSATLGETVVDNGGMILVNPGTQTNRVRTSTFDLNGTFANRRFHLQVIC